MSDKFNIAMETVFKNEGGFSDNKFDPGGKTRWGVSQRAFPDVDIEHLTRDGAMKIYFENYWNPLYEQINDQRIVTKLVDTGINVGLKHAVQILQEALYNCGDTSIVSDGHFGPQTLAAVNNMEPNGLLFQMRAAQGAYYQHLMDGNPKLRVFAKGWAARALS